MMLLHRYHVHNYFWNCILIISGNQGLDKPGFSNEDSDHPAFGILTTGVFMVLKKKRKKPFWN